MYIHTNVEERKFFFGELAKFYKKRLRRKGKVGGEERERERLFILIIINVTRFCNGIICMYICMYHMRKRKIEIFNISIVYVMYICTYVIVL